MFDAVAHFGALGVVEAFQCSDEIAGDPADALKAHGAVLFVASALGADVAGDHARVAAHRVAVDGVIDAAVADPGLFHGTHDLLEGLGVVRAQAVQLDVADVTAVGQFVIG